MGVDCTAIVEYDEKINGKTWWEIVGYHQLDRNTEFFQIIDEEAYMGYPDDISKISKRLLDETECYGECWMPIKDFMELCKEQNYCFKKFKKFYKKKDYDRLRIIFRFDH